MKRARRSIGNNKRQPTQEGRKANLVALYQQLFRDLTHTAQAKENKIKKSHMSQEQLPALIQKVKANSKQRLKVIDKKHHSNGPKTVKNFLKSS